MSKKFFNKNFKKAALSLAGVLFAGSLAGSALTLAGQTATADNVVDLYYSSSVFNVETGATYKDDTGKSGVKLTTKASGTSAEGASFDLGDGFSGEFEMDFRVTSKETYAHTATAGWTHYLTNGYQKYLFADNMNPYLDLKEVGITFTSNSNPDKYFTVYIRGTSHNVAFATSASVYVPGDGVYATTLNFSHFNTTPEEAIWCGYGLDLSGVQAYPGDADYGVGTINGYQNLLTPIRATSFSNFGATSSGNAAEAPTTSNLVKFDAEEMKVYVNAGKGGNTYSTQNTTADVLVRDLATNAGYSSTNNIPVGSLSKADFANGYSVSIAYTDVTENETVGDCYNEAKSQYMFGGYSQYPALETPYDRYPSMTIYSVNGNAVNACNVFSATKQEQLVSFDTNDVTVTADSLNAVDNRRGLNFKSVASGTAAEGAGFAFNNVMYGNFETDFRVTSAQTYSPKKGYTHYLSQNSTSYKQTMSDNLNPYLDLKEVAFKFTSATNPSEYFKVFFRGASSTAAFSTTAYVYIPGDTGAYKLTETGEKVYGYGLSNQGRYPYDGTTTSFAGVGTYNDLWNMPNIWGTSFSNYTSTSTTNTALGALTSNLLKFDVNNMAVYINSGTGYNTKNIVANVPLRYLETNDGANPDLALGSLSKDDFIGGYTVSVEFTDVTANGTTGWTKAEMSGENSVWSDYDAYVNAPEAYDRYANMTIYSVNGQSLSYMTAGDETSGILDQTNPVLYVPDSEIYPLEEIDVTPSFYDVLGGNSIGLYGKVSYSTDGGVTFTEIVKNAENKYLFTPEEITTYTFKYENFKDLAGKKAATLTVERECALGFNMTVGASVRTAGDETSGIRFEATLSKVGYDWFVAEYGAENMKFFYEISANGVTKTQEIAADKILFEEDENTYYMRAAVVGLSEAQYDMVFTARVYMTAGDDTYTAVANDNVRSIREVAQKIVADTEYFQSLETWRREIIGKYAGHYPLEADLGIQADMRGHVQGTAVSSDGRYIFHSMSDSIAKQDVLTGKIVGRILNGVTVLGETMHLGDITYYDGKVYGALMRTDALVKAANCFVLIIEADKMVGDINFTATYVENGETKPVVKLAYVGKPILDNFVNVNGVGDYSNATEYGQFGGKFGIVNTLDSTTVGPAFGADDDGEQYLTFGLGMPGWAKTAPSLNDANVTVNATARSDNDYLVIAQYDIAAVEAVAVACNADGDLYAAAVEAAGDNVQFANTYFFYMGYHDFGLQNLTYDAYKDAYIATPYGVMETTEFPNFQTFVISAAAYETAALVGNGEATGKVVSALCGVQHESGSIGYPDYWGVGVISLGNGYYYLNTSTNQTTDGVTKYGSCSNLYKWDEARAATNQEFPFVLVK